MTFVFLGLKVTRTSCNFESNKQPQCLSRVHGQPLRAKPAGPSLRAGRMDGNQKIPSNFFILCVYIDHAYINLHMKSKIFTYILMCFKV